MKEQPREKCRCKHVEAVHLRSLGCMASGCKCKTYFPRKLKPVPAGTQKVKIPKFKIWNKVRGCYVDDYNGSNQRSVSRWFVNDEGKIVEAVCFPPSEEWLFNTVNQEEYELHADGRKK